MYVRYSLPEKAYVKCFVFGERTSIPHSTAEYIHVGGQCWCLVKLRHFKYAW